MKKRSELSEKIVPICETILHRPIDELTQKRGGEQIGSKKFETSDSLRLGISNQIDWNTVN